MIKIIGYLLNINWLFGKKLEKKLKWDKLDLVKKELEDEMLFSVERFGEGWIRLGKLIFDSNPFDKEKHEFIRENAADIRHVTEEAIAEIKAHAINDKEQAFVSIYNGLLAIRSMCEYLIGQTKELEKINIKTQEDLLNLIKTKHLENLKKIKAKIDERFEHEKKQFEKMTAKNQHTEAAIELMHKIYIKINDNLEHYHWEMEQLHL